MAERRWIVVICLSESFRTTLRDMATQFGAGLLEWNPKGDQPVPGNGGPLIILAGGAESEALELWGGCLPTSVPNWSWEGCRITDSRRPRYSGAPVITSPCRKTWTSSVGSLERELREVGENGRAAIRRGGAKASGFAAIIGRSSVLRTMPGPGG